MKLGDMSFDDSRVAELQIIPIIEKIRTNAETAKLLDTLLAGNEGKQFTDMNADEKRSYVKRRVELSKELTKLLVHSHYEEICGIFAAIHKIKVADVKKWKRSEANQQIAEMLNDGDLQSFFMSPDALALAVSSATWQSLESSPQEQP